MNIYIFNTNTKNKTTKGKLLEHLALSTRDYFKLVEQNRISRGIHVIGELALIASVVAD